MAREEVVVDLEARRADHVEVVLHHEVVDLVDRACRRVLDRQDPELAEALLDGAEDAFEGIEVADRGVLEDALGRNLRVGALDALAGDEAVLREAVGRGRDCPANPLELGARGADEGGLAHARGLHEELHEHLRVGLEVIGHLARDVGDLGALASAVVHPQPVGLLVSADLLGGVGALDEELEDPVVDVVDPSSQLGHVFHGVPHSDWFSCVADVSGSGGQERMESRTTSAQTASTTGVPRMAGQVSWRPFTVSLAGVIVVRSTESCSR